MAVVRPASENDRGAVIALWDRAGLIVAHNPPGADFDRALASPQSDILIAEHGDQMVASVMIGDDGHRAWVYYLAVDPAYERAGLGHQMMAAAEDWARTRGARKLQLMIRPDNTQVRDFYAATGYEETPRLVMAKWLAN